MVKKGFSLAEALIVMAVISIFFALATKVIAVKPKDKVQNNPHGYFECYLDDGLKQRTVTEGVESVIVEKEGACDFTPPTGVAFFNIHTYGPEYYIGFEPNINNAVKLSVSSDKLAIQNADTEYVYKTVIDEDVTESSENDQRESAKNNVINYLRVLYSDSKMYNGGNVRTGIIISW